MRILDVSLPILLPALLAAQNLVPNGSFELGTDGFRLRSVLRFDQNPGLQFFPLVTVQDPEADGKFVLKLSNPHGNRFEIHSRQFQFKPNTDYTFRFCGKSTFDGQKLLFRPYSVANKWRDWFFTAEMTPHWKTYEFKFKTGPHDGKPFFYHFQIRNADNREIPGSDIFLDKLELFESGTTSGTGLELAVSVDEPLIAADGESNVETILKAGNFSDKRWSGTVTVTATDEYLTKNTVSVKESFTLAPGEVQKIPVRLKTGYGAFRVTAAADGAVHSLPAAFAVIGKYERKELNFEQDFCLGINDGVFVIQTEEDPNRGVRVFNADMEKRFEYWKKMGCRLIRNHDGGIEPTSWAFMEPEQGKWDYSNLDFQLDLFKKHGFELVEVVDRVNSWRLTKKQRWWHPPRRAEWLDALSHEAEFKDYNWRNVKGTVWLPPLELWRNYVRNMVTRVRGRIRFYEIFNEPNGLMSAEDYFPYLKSFYEEVKKIDPGSRVIGLCVTSDFGTTGDRFVTDVMKQGGGKYMDIASFHPYQGRELSSVVPADRYIENFRKSLGPEYEQKMPIWNTELYYVFDTNQNHSASNPAQVAARFLTDLGERVAQAPFFQGDLLWSRYNIAPEGESSPDSIVELVPNGRFVVCNALARYFEAARPVTKFRVANGVGCYLYRKEGKLIAAVWNWGKKHGVSADFSGMKVLDLYGNRAREGYLNIAEAPYYVLSDGFSDREFTEKLKNLRFRFTNPLSAAPATRNVAGKYLLATIRNDSSEQYEAIIGFQGRRITAAENINAVIPAERAINVQIPIRSKRGDSESTLQIYARNMMTAFPVTVRDNIAIPAGEQVVLSDGDFRASWVIRKTDGKIIFEATVRDSTNSGSNAAGREPWEQDSVELFFDAEPDSLSAHSYRYTPETFRVFLLPRFSGKKQMEVWFHRRNHRFRYDDITYSFTAVADGYRLKVTLPAEKFGTMLGFDVKFNDALPGKKSHRKLHWTNEENNHKDRTLFGIVEP